MNIQQAKNISIRSILESFSLFPSKENSKTAFYFALDREEKTPSLSVDFVKNSAFDFGTGKKYDNISLVQAIKFYTVSEALKYLEKFDLAISSNLYLKPASKFYSIITIKNIQHFALLQYLKERNLYEQIHHLKEIHYNLDGKKYFGIAFKNDCGGYEVRNKYSKVCIGNKSITTISNSSTEVKIFEGFTDFLSFKKINNNSGVKESDYIILNSVTQIYTLRNLSEKYTTIEIYLDNDSAGDLGTFQLIKKFPNALDKREVYKGYKDLNDFLLSNY